jgi:hypothetical protein
MGDCSQVHHCEERSQDIAREEAETDFALFMLWPYLLLSFVVIAFYSAAIGLAVMIGLFTVHAIYCAIVTPVNNEQVWF